MEQENEKRQRLVIAVDGPAGAGKSTVARRVAAALNYLYIDTGAMYRAIALAVLEEGVGPDDGAAVERLARGLDVELVPSAAGNRVLLEGRDVTERIRAPEVSAAASQVAALPRGRRRMGQLHRRSAGGGGVVMDGRDIGTVVFPDADVKVFLTASAEERARRRWLELRAAGHAPSLDDIRANIESRDRLDSTRDVAPLRKAEDAVEIDTTDKTVDEVVDQVLELVRKELDSCSTE
ncbi:MAG: (d)CMP kinase [Bacillota bacterium]|nr:MAG: (d)CMP kinase [Bacillota bacterium]